MKAADVPVRWGVKGGGGDAPLEAPLSGTLLHHDGPGMSTKDWLPSKPQRDLSSQRKMDPNSGFGVEKLGSDQVVAWWDPLVVSDRV